MDQRGRDMSVEDLRELCALTVELTKLRQAECKHLCIENFAPELLGKLICERMGVAPQPWWQPPCTITCGGLQE